MKQRAVYLFMAFYIGILLTTIPGVWRTVHGLWASKHVYDVCNSARLETSRKSENKCAAIQESEHREFICEMRNQEVSTHCWVEAI